MARSAIAQLGGDPAAVPSGSAGGQDIEGRPGAQCLAAHPRVGRRAVGRVRLGLTRRALARRVKVAPARRSRLAQIWCTKGATGRVAAVFSKRSSRSRVEMIITTAPAKAFRQRYPHRRSLGPGLFRSSPRSNRLLYARARARSVRRGHAKEPVPAVEAAGPRLQAGARLDHSSFTPRAQVVHRRRRDLTETRDPWLGRGGSSSARESVPPSSSGSGRPSGMTCSAPPAPRQAARAPATGRAARPTSTASCSPRAFGHG